MKSKRYKAMVSAMRWAVSKGAVSVEQAASVIHLGKASGYFRAPAAGEPTDSRLKGNTVKTKTKRTDPKSLAGSKAAELFRVKEPSEKFAHTKTALKYKNGAPVMLGGKAVESSSERELAQIGCWLKNHLRKQGVPGVMLREWEENLLREMCAKSGWHGDFGGFNYSGGSPDGFLPREVVRKAVLDDTVSGGIYLSPAQFDEALVTYPLLHSELLPEIELRPGQGRRMMSATVANPTMAWGTMPGSQVQPFATSGLIGPLDTTLFNLQGACEISNDLLADTPVALASTLIALFGEKQKELLDRCIVSGNGTSEPQGIFNAAGLTTISTDNGTAGPPTVSDYEGLYFGIAKQYREQRDGRCVYIGNDTSYRRAMGIQVGPGDERRVFGMNHADYMLLGRPYKVQNDIPNSRIAFGNLKKYRLYNRGGSEVVLTREGRALSLANTSLLVLRSRWGGKLTDGAAFCVAQDAQG